MSTVPEPADSNSEKREPRCISLTEIYSHAIEEYRFEVKLTWDRVKFYLGLNIALLAAVATLLRIDSESWLPLVLVSFIGILASGLGISTIGEGHRYYRRTIWKKTFIEDLLGLNESIRTQEGQPGTLAIATTRSQEDTNYILNDKDAWLARKIERNRITWKLKALMWLFICLHLFVIVSALWNMCPCNAV